MRKIIEDMSFQGKIFVGMLLATVISMLAGYFVLLQVVQIIYLSNMKKEARAELKTVQEALDAAILELGEGLDGLSTNSHILCYLERANSPVLEKQVYRALYHANSRYGRYGYFSLYNSAGNLLMINEDSHGASRQMPLDWGIFYQAARAPRVHIVRNAIIYHENSEDRYMRVARAVTDESEQIIGFVVATVLSNGFERICQSEKIGRNPMIIIQDDYSEIGYCSYGSCPKEELREVKEFFMGNSKEVYAPEEKDYFYCMRKSKEGEMNLFLKQETSSREEIKALYRTISVIFGSIMLAISVLVSGAISRSLHKNVNELQAAMASLRRGDFKSRVSVTGKKDAIGRLSESFNDMSRYIEGNLERRISKEREWALMNIKMMQAQLNPHFLYNTLDTIKWIGKANQIPEIATLSEGLAQILRMSISAKPMILLEQELQFVTSYVEIQRIRFDDRFEFILDVPEELKRCRIPKLTLQPLVENSIIHGFEESESGIIILVARKEKRESGDELIISIKDNGCGIAKERLKELREDNFEPVWNEPGNKNGKTGGSIGCHNVNAIIKLNYGEAYGIEINSEVGVGTEVIVRLPLKYGLVDNA
ncbi:MAG: cache domain-containing sensor histidine kinase [Acetivibrio ethanolgignens]